MIGTLPRARCLIRALCNIYMTAGRMEEVSFICLYASLAAHAE